jgi:hypothetical protein
VLQKERLLPRKKTVTKKVTKKTPAKKSPAKPKTPAKPKGVTAGAAGKDSKGNIIVMGGKKGDLKKAQELFRNKAKNADVSGRPVQGPANYKGNFFKNKAAREADVSGRPVQGPSGVEAFKAGKKAGASQARKTAKKRLSKVVKGKGAISKTARKIGKKTKKIAGGKLGTAAIAGGAGYAGAKMGSGNKAVTPSPATAKPSKYFTREEIEAAHYRIYGKKKK